MFCSKVHLEHYGITWNILHRTSTKNYKEIEVNPSTLGRVHFSGKIGTTQPYQNKAVGTSLALAFGSEFDQQRPRPLQLQHISIVRVRCGLASGRYPLIIFSRYICTCQEYWALPALRLAACSHPPGVSLRWCLLDPRVPAGPPGASPGPPLCPPVLLVSLGSPVCPPVPVVSGVSWVL